MTTSSTHGYTRKTGGTSLRSDKTPTAHFTGPGLDWINLAEQVSGHWALQVATGVSLDIWVTDLFGRKPYRVTRNPSTGRQAQTATDSSSRRASPSFAIRQAAGSPVRWISNGPDRVFSLVTDVRRHS
jgi:hypothetical protein